jgi:hypothetical protein
MFVNFTTYLGDAVGKRLGRVIHSDLVDSYLSQLTKLTVRTLGILRAGVPGKSHIVLPRCSTVVELSVNRQNVDTYRLVKH